MADWNEKMLDEKYFKELAYNTTFKNTNRLTPNQNPFHKPHSLPFSSSLEARTFTRTIACMKTMTNTKTTVTKFSTFLSRWSEKPKLSERLLEALVDFRSVSRIKP